jgi:hypothetical protein
MNAVIPLVIVSFVQGPRKNLLVSAHRNRLVRPVFVAPEGTAVH